MNGTDKILIILGVFMLCFTAAVLWLFYKTSSEPTVLITVVGGAIVAELVALFKLKAEKKRKRKKEDEDQ
jgi:uncharacterized integral membrane protein